MKILLADDSQTILDVLSFLLQSHGYEVITASDGVEAIIKAYHTLPDLLLLDIEMPKMNGYQVCRLLKSDETTKTIPIIILTSRDQKRDRFWGLSTGADEYITKDFESEEDLFTAIQRVLEQQISSSGTVEEEPKPDSRKRSRSDSALLAEAEMTELSVLERVNHILDRQLFQATIVNELSYLAINMHSFSATIRSIFTLLGKVCEFRVASILLKAHQRYTIFLYAIPPINQEFLDSVKCRVLQVYSEYHPHEQVDSLEETILHPELQNPEIRGSEELRTFFALPVKVRNDVIGVLALGHSLQNMLNEDVLETLQVFINEVSIVLDNALLVKQLEQSNCDLENTITELKSTQSQLVQSEKMASLGQLVAGVAHEINTPAGAINAAAANLMNFLPSVPASFRVLLGEHFSPDDQENLLIIISRLFGSIIEKRKSTLSLRQEAKGLETLLAQEGFDDVRRLAKQIARLELKDSTTELLHLLKQYNSTPLIEFLENCGKIVNATKDIKLSIDIIARIVNALKMYSRLDQAKVEEVDVHEGIETTLIILQNQIKLGVEVKRNYGDLPKIFCYANELNQVWTNLIHNALQAMNGTGTLTIETYRLSQEPDMGRGDTGPPDADEIQEEKIGVKITDTGPGIPKEIQAKIFDPYFTTKDQGEGSGLGLGIAQQIVERHYGEIRFSSQPGETNFEVCLPVSALREEYLAQ